MDSSGVNLSPQDRDLAVRTVLGEAGNQGDDGMLGVANVILNRAASGRFGPSVSAVVTAPGQFEPWQAKPRELMSYSPDDPAYQRAGQIVDAAATGQAPDITGGATHFYAPRAQASMGRNPPAWGRGQPTAVVGAHAFYAPEGTVRRQQQQKPDDDVDGLLSAWGVGSTSSQGGSSQPAAPASTPAPASQDGSQDVDGMLAAWGAAPAAKPAQDAAPAQPDARPLTIHAKDPSAAFGTLDGARSAMQSPTAPAPTNNALAAGVSGAIDGIPVVGPYALAGMERLSAFQRSQDNGTSFGDELAATQAADAARRQDHPTATTAGEIGGNLLGYGALGATSAGAQALGLTGDNLLMRVAAGGVTNAAIGGGDAAVRSGGDAIATGMGAGVGGLAGAAGPIIGRAVEAGANRLLPYLESFRPGQAAPNSLQQAIAGTGGNLDDMAARLQANPRLSLMDVNPGARNIAQGLAAQPGEARDTLVRAYEGRAAGAQNAVTGAYDAAMGPQPDVLATLNGIRQTAAANARQGFGAALRNAGPVDLSATIQSLDDQIRPGVGQITSNETGIPLGPVEQRLQRIRASLTDGTSVLTDPQRLHQLQSNLRTEAETLLSSSTGSDRLMGRAVMGARNNIVSAIDDATGGTFRPAQQQYASDQAVGDAFEKGLSIFSNRSGVSGLEDRPEYWRQFVQNASPGEVDALRLGARTAVDQQMNSVRNATRKGAGIPEVGFNRDKLAAVLGDQETGRLAQRLADEQDIAHTNNALFEGSQTQPRQQAKAAVAVRDLAPISAEIGLPTFAAMSGAPWTAAGLTAAALARRGVQFAGQRADLARNTLQAQMLTAQGPAAQATLNRLMTAAASGPQRLPIMARGAGANAALLAAGAPADRNRLFDALQRR